MEKTTGEKAMNMDYASTDVNSAKFKIENAFADYINLLDKATTRDTLIEGAKKLASEVLNLAGIAKPAAEKENIEDSEEVRSTNIRTLYDLGGRLKTGNPSNEAYIILGADGPESVATLYGNPGSLFRLLLSLKKKAPEALNLLSTLITIV